jgi:hypothetical protein
MAAVSSAILAAATSSWWRALWSSAPPFSRAASRTPVITRSCSITSFITSIVDAWVAIAAHASVD